MNGRQQRFPPALSPAGRSPRPPSAVLAAPRPLPPPRRAPVPPHRLRRDGPRLPPLRFTPPLPPGPGPTEALPPVPALLTPRLTGLGRPWPPSSLLCCSRRPAAAHGRNGSARAQFRPPPPATRLPRISRAEAGAEALGAAGSPSPRPGAGEPQPPATPCPAPPGRLRPSWEGRLPAPAAVGPRCLEARPPGPVPPLPSAPASPLTQRPPGATPLTAGKELPRAAAAAVGPPGRPGLLSSRTRPAAAAATRRPPGGAAAEAAPPRRGTESKAGGGGKLIRTKNTAARSKKGLRISTSKNQKACAASARAALLALSRSSHCTLCGTDSLRRAASLDAERPRNRSQTARG